MIGPYLVIAADPPLTLLSVGDSAPGLSYPVLTGVGAIHQPADGSESANVSMDADNADGALSALLAVPPLRAPAVVHGPDGVEWFRGVLAGVTLADGVKLELEA